MKIYYDRQIEILRNEKENLKKINERQQREITKLKENKEELTKDIEDKSTQIESQISIIKNKETVISGLENVSKEFDIKMNRKIKEMQDNFTKEKQKYVNELDNLFQVIDGIFSKQKNKFDEAFLKLSEDSQEKLKRGALNYKMK